MKIEKQGDGYINVQFDYGVQVQNLKAKEEKTSFFGKLFSGFYTVLYNWSAGILGIERRAIRYKTKIYTIETSVFEKVIKGNNRSKLIKRLSNIETFKNEVKKNGGEKQFLESQEAQDIFRVLLRHNSHISDKALSNFAKTIITLSFRHFAETGDIGDIMKQYSRIENDEGNILFSSALWQTSLYISLRDYKKYYIEKGNRFPVATDKHIDKLIQKSKDLIKKEDYRELNECYESYRRQYYYHDFEKRTERTNIGPFWSGDELLNKYVVADEFLQKLHNVKL